MPECFVSYASIDRLRTMQIVEAVQSQGLDVWIDQAGIAGGTAYGTEIANALRDAEAVLLIASDASLASKNVRQEIMLAWRYDKPIIPLILHPLVFPDDVAYWLEGAQWIEVLDREPAEWLPKLGQALARHGILRAADVPGRISEAVPLVGAGNLPGTLPPILGRAQEIEELLTLLGVVRTVTLTGPGGTGKTRLALEIGQRLGPSLPGGVWFVDLSPVTDAALALPSLVDAMQLEEAPDQPAIERIADAIGDRPALVIFDNLEQIANIGPVLLELQARIPSALLISTTRGALGLPDEFVYPVNQLTLPDLNRLPPPAELLQNAAVELFVARAREAKPDFQLNDGNARAVAEICHRLDGLPLAIEIAAARTRLLPPAALLTRLGSRLSLLTRGSASSARQQTLRDTIAWSFNLLGEAEQRAFRALAVFTGGASIEAAEFVLAGGDGAGGAIDALEGLVDQNLVKLEASVGDASRLRMLETIREFALEELQRAGDEAAVRRAHSEYFATLIEGLQPDYNDSMSRFDQLTVRQELPNARTALDWIHHSGDSAREIEFVNALFAYWRVAGPYAEAATSIGRALESEGDLDPLQRGDALSALGWLAGAESDFTRAVAHFDAALLLYRAAERPDREAGAHLQLALAAEFTSKFDVARAHQLERLHYHESIGNELGVARVEQDLSRIAYFQGDYTGSIQLGLRSLEIFRRNADISHTAAVLVDLASTEMLSGLATESIGHIGEAVRLLKTLDDGYGLSVATVTQGRALQLAGETAAAAVALQDGLARADELGDQNLRSLALYGLGALAVSEGDYDLARVRLEEALRLVQERGDRWLETEIWDMLGQMALGQGAFEGAARFLGRGDGIRQRLGTQVSPVHRAPHEAAVEALRNELGDARYQALWDEGHAMDASVSVES